MAWPGGKQSLKAKRVNPKRKINWEQLGLAAPTKDPSTVPIEEIRRQVTMLAGRVEGGKGGIPPAHGTFVGWRSSGRCTTGCGSMIRPLEVLHASTCDFRNRLPPPFRAPAG